MRYSVCLNLSRIHCLFNSILSSPGKNDDYILKSIVEEKFGTFKGVKEKIVIIAFAILLV